MKIGVADYGMSVWDGGAFDVEDRLLKLREIGYEGIERLEASEASEALLLAATARKLGMAFTTCRGPRQDLTIRWAAGLGMGYVWTAVSGQNLEVFCRQVNTQVAAAARWGVQVGLHNHLGTPVETQEQLEEFLARCPECKLVLDTGHLAAAGGDPEAIIRAYASRLIVVHVKDWFMIDESIGYDRWYLRGRFCELGMGNIGQDHKAIVRALKEVGYDGWIFVEHDTHLRDPLIDLAVSREYLRAAGV